MTDEQAEALMQPWRKDFAADIERIGVDEKCIHNTDQTALPYEKLPNSLYLKKNEKKEIKRKQEHER